MDTEEAKVIYWSVRTAKPWEKVNHFKVNKWMKKIGAKWVLSEPIDFSHDKQWGNRWKLYDMEFTQIQAAQLYLAAHKRWWQR